MPIASASHPIVITDGELYNVLNAPNGGWQKGILWRVLHCQTPVLEFNFAITLWLALEL